MNFFEAPGTPRLHYEIDDYTDPWKPARTILLQHGFARSGAFWRNWVPYLSRFYKVLRPDLRGLGLSSKDFDLETNKIEDYLDDFKKLLDHLGIDSLHYCGEFSGGILGMRIAAAFPDRVRTLSLVGSPVYQADDNKRSALGGYSDRIAALRGMGVRAWLEASNAGRRYPADADPGMLQWTVDEMAKSDTDVLVAYHRWLSVQDATPFLSKIQAPVLGLYPQQGTVVKEDHVERLTRLVPNIRMVRLNTTAQGLQMAEPAACATEVLHFISQHDGICCHE